MFDVSPIAPDSLTDEVGRKYYKCENLDANSDINAPDMAEGRSECTRAEANLISSETNVGTHKPVLDIDIPCRYVPSSTEGHGHLYIDSPLPWVAYEKLLTCLKDAGIIQVGYWKRSLERKATFVRPPWIKKPNTITNSGL